MTFRLNMQHNHHLQQNSHVLQCGRLQMHFRHFGQERLERMEQMNIRIRFKSMIHSQRKEDVLAVYLIE